MAVDATSGSGMDLNQLLNSALQGGTMSNLFGNDAAGMPLGLVLGLALSRGGLFGDSNGNQNADRAAIDSAVSAALAQNNQANNNSMLLLKDIQDSSQDIVNAVNSTSQTNLIQQLQSQIAIQTGMATLGTAISEAKGSIVNEVHEVGQVIGNQLDTINTNMLQGFNNVSREIVADGAATRALITQNQITNMQDTINELRSRQIASENGVNVTNNINQNQQQQQQQQLLLTNANLLQQLVAEQRITNGYINIGGTQSGNTASAANTRVNG